MFNKLPPELQNIIYDYVFQCRKDQNFYINKEITFFICKKNKNCKCIRYFNKSICYHCNRDIIRMIHNMFMPHF